MKDKKAIMEYSIYAIAFIDILGQAKEYQKIINSYYQEERVSKELLDDVHEKTYLTTERLRNRFRQYKGSVKDFINKHETDYPDIVKNFFFSDTIISYVSLKNDMSISFKPKLFALCAMLQACAFNMLDSLNEGKPFRGGISCLYATEIINENNKEIFGPAFYEAAKLEADIAEYPRIVIADSTVNFLNCTINSKLFKGHNEQDRKDSQAIASKLKSFIRVDTDGIHILDYVGEEFQNFIFGDDRDAFQDYKSSVLSAFQWINQECIRFKEKRNIKLYQRYNRLKDYFMFSSPIVQEFIEQQIADSTQN